jgi:D-alanyl-D-alanine carboxypeptidase/D-alanyl-D-alanine-endopeptidase (penicillin-binding protein 4)
LFGELMSSTGGVGSVEKRLLGTAAEGRVFAKTGTLTGHRNLVALVQALNGRWLVMTVMVGGVVVPRQVVDGAVDRVLLALVTSSS